MSNRQYYTPHPSSDYYASPPAYTYSPSQINPATCIPQPVATPTSTSTASSPGISRKTPLSASTVSLSATGNALGSSVFPGSASSAARRRETHDKNLPNGAHYGEKAPQLNLSNSRKRARPMSTDLTQSSFASQHSAKLGTYSMFNPPTRYSDVQIPSPEPPVNLHYDLAGGGAYTPGFFATPGFGDRKMSESSLTGVGRADGRFARRAWVSRGEEEAVQADEDGDLDMGGAMSADMSFDSGAQNAQQGSQRLQKSISSQPGWGQYVLGVVGGVVGGVWAFCRNSAAFRGFYAGNGPGYDIAPPPNTPAQNWKDVAASENMWEDDDNDDASRRTREEDSLVRSFDRLETPIPGDYPPSPDESDIYEMERNEESERGSKRRQSDRGEWVVVPNYKSAAASASKRDALRQRSRTNSPMSDGSALRQRHSYAQSPTMAHRRIASGRRPKHRVSYAGSPAQQQLGPDIQQRPSSRGQQRYSTGNFGTVSPGSKKTSPPSVEAKRFAARIRREEKVVEQKVEKINDKLLEMIRQGKEALGAKVEIVEGEDDEMF